MINKNNKNNPISNCWVYFARKLFIPYMLALDWLKVPQAPWGGILDFMGLTNFIHSFCWGLIVSDHLYHYSTLKTHCKKLHINNQRRNVQEAILCYPKIIAITHYWMLPIDWEMAEIMIMQRCMEHCSAAGSLFKIKTWSFPPKKQWCKISAESVEKWLRYRPQSV